MKSVALLMRDIVYFIALLVISMFIFLWLFVNLPFVASRDVANGTTGKQIKEVKIGMAVDEVMVLLGPPYTYSAGVGLHQLSCEHPKKNYIDVPFTDSTDIHQEIENIFSDSAYCCEGNREDLSYRFFSFEYTRPVSFFSYPRLWISFDEHGKVSRVCAKRYDWTNDYVIYELSAETGDKGCIDEKGFRECFE